MTDRIETSENQTEIEYSMHGLFAIKIRVLYRRMECFFDAVIIDGLKG
jgi:hypothetical protein